MAKKTMRRVKGKQWCDVDVEIENGRLSISGAEGSILEHRHAKQAARAYWISYFDENPGAIAEMNGRCGSRCRTSGGAADYVLRADGELHGVALLQVAP